MQSLPHQVHSQPKPRLSRRSLVSKCALGTGLAALTGRVLSAPLVGRAQFSDSTPDASAAPGPTFEAMALGPTVQSKAAELEYDLEKIFRFVSEEVRYEPYSGALRGANGTLWSLAGNSVDKSILMAALLDESLIVYRYATGSLDESAANLLRAAATPEAEQLRTSAVNAFVAGFTPTSQNPLGASASPEILLTDEGLKTINEISLSSEKALALATALADSQIDIITSALVNAGIILPDVLESVFPVSEIERHTWVQVQDGPVWNDFVLAFAPGTSIPVAAETTAKLPTTDHHQVTIRIVAEEFIGGTNVRRDVVTLRGESLAFLNAPVAVTVMPPGAFDGLGLTINQMFSGRATYVPSILARDVYVVADVPIVFGSGEDEGGVLGVPDAPVSELGEGETLGLWFAVDIESPGSETVSIERTLLDRVNADQRRLGKIDFTTIDHVKFAGDFNGAPMVTELAVARIVNIDSVRLPFSYAESNGKALETFGPAMFGAPCMQAFRDGLRLRSEIDRGYHSFLATPQVTISSVSLVDLADENSGSRLELDLAYHQPMTTLLASPVPTDHFYHPNLYAGVLDLVAESVIFHAELMTDSVGKIIVGPTVASVMEAALNSDIQIRPVATLGELEALGLPAQAITLIEPALAAGWIAIVPERPVMIGAEERLGWWLVDPATGHTRDQMDDGQHGASVMFPKGGTRFSVGKESATLNRISYSVRLFFRALGESIGCLLGWSALTLAGVAGMAVYSEAPKSLTANTVALAGAAGYANAIYGLMKKGGACV